MRADDDPYFTATDKAKPHPPRGMAQLVVRIPWCLSWVAVALLSMQVFVSPIIYQSRLATGAYIMTEIGAGAARCHLGLRRAGHPTGAFRRLARSVHEETGLVDTEGPAGCHPHNDGARGRLREAPANKAMQRTPLRGAADLGR